MTSEGVKEHILYISMLITVVLTFPFLFILELWLKHQEKKLTKHEEK